MLSIRAFGRHDTDEIFIVSGLCIFFFIFFKSFNSLATVPSADNFCKQFGPSSVPTKRRAWSGSKLFDILKEFFQKVDFEKYQQTTKGMKNYPAGKE